MDDALCLSVLPITISIKCFVEGPKVKNIHTQAMTYMNNNITVKLNSFCFMDN